MRLIDRFMPVADVRDEHHVDVHAPAGLVYDIATKMDMQALPLIHALLWVRAKLMRAPLGARPATELVAELEALGWQVLARGGDEIVLGVAATPWHGDPQFRGISPDRFADFCEPGMVKIAVSLEAVPLGPTRTRFSTETRVKATDAAAMLQFASYWRKVMPGIVLIRLAMLRALKRDAEAQYDAHCRELGQAA
jgi:hypothetical protein